jgi:hypothetical protein
MLTSSTLMITFEIIQREKVICSYFLFYSSDEISGFNSNQVTMERFSANFTAPSTLSILIIPSFTRLEV